MYLAEKGGKLGGREIQLVKLDDESKPELGLQNADRLIKRDNVDVLIGTVHSGVQMAIHKAVTESGTLCIVPNAGAVAVTRNLCAKNVFRTSFSNWQPAYGMGVALGKRGVKKAAWITWDYAAGAESGEGFKQGLEANGGQVVQTLTLKFPETNFQPLLAQVPGLGVDAVGAFFAGGGAINFVKDYAAAGLKVPLVGSGFLTEGVLGPQGAAAEGVETALHYGDGLDNPKNNALPRRLQDQGRPRGRRLRGAGLRLGAAARHRARSREGQPRQRGRPATRRCAKPGSTARAARSASRSRRRSCRTSTCARRPAA